MPTYSLPSRNAIPARNVMGAPGWGKAGEDSTQGFGSQLKEKRSGSGGDARILTGADEPL